MGSRPTCPTLKAGHYLYDLLYRFRSGKGVNWRCLHCLSFDTHSLAFLFALLCSALLCFSFFACVCIRACIPVMEVLFCFSHACMVRVDHCHAISFAVSML